MCSTVFKGGTKNKKNKIKLAGRVEQNDLTAHRVYIFRNEKWVVMGGKGKRKTDRERESVCVLEFSHLSTWKTKK